MKVSSRTLIKVVAGLAFVALVVLVCSLVTCNAPIGGMVGTANKESAYLSFADGEPTSLDPQCILENYIVPLNVFDRLIEVEERDGEAVLVPSLAESWKRSADGLTYSFALRDGVTYSNGAALTSSDVKYSFERLLIHPESRHADLVSDILGATELMEGKTTELKGFHVVDDLHFSITLAHPATSFLAGLTTPAASILDEDTTREAGDAFGHDVEQTVGTGPFSVVSWAVGKSITMIANPEHWAGAPACAGLKMQFFSEASIVRDLYARGMIDILDCDKFGMEVEFFLRGDAYLRNLVRGRRVGITYIALNNASGPLSDVRVRRALTLALNRKELLMGSIGGRGTIENGIFPRGLLGHNDKLPDLPYDPEQAKALLGEAGLPDGFDLTVSCVSNSSQNVHDLLTLTQDYWSRIGVRVHLEELDSSTFEARRRAGELDCYTSTFSADYNDPQNFTETFFETREATDGRSICYQDEEIMQRAFDARSIVDEAERLRVYQEVEKKIVQEDYAWIPLYSRMHFFVVSDRVEGFEVRWNGWSSNRYYKVSVQGSGS